MAYFAMLKYFVLAFCRVTIWLMDGGVKQGIREYHFANLDHATASFTMQQKQALGEVKDIEVAMLSE